jgi:uncharacterized membrane protein YhaH (DUF805 family)
MTDKEEEAVESLRSVEELRARTRLARSGHWFVLLVFGVVVLGAMPFYIVTVPTASSPGCQALSGGVVGCAHRRADSFPLGGALNPLFSEFSLGRWATVYWAIAMLAGFSAVVAFYRRRAAAVGVQGRIWPMVAVGIGLLVVVLRVDSPYRSLPPIPDLWVRGTGALLIVALGIVVLALLERSRAFVVFAAGFCGLALLSCLYDEVNIFGRVGLGGPFGGTTDALPNLIVPGLYLILGGVGFWLGVRRTRRATWGQA